VGRRERAGGRRRRSQHHVVAPLSRTLEAVVVAAPTSRDRQEARRAPAPPSRPIRAATVRERSRHSVGQPILAARDALVPLAARRIKPLYAANLLERHNHFARVSPVEEADERVDSVLEPMNHSFLVLQFPGYI
jgi:hypothetical protein